MRQLRVYAALFSLRKADSIELRENLVRGGGPVIQPADIRSLTDFKRRTAEIVQHLKKTGRPHVLTVNGRAEVVVQDVASYQRLLDLVERAAAIEGIRQGLDSAARGEGRPVDEVFAEIRSRYDAASDR